jgi:hypothetical protein
VPQFIADAQKRTEDELRALLARSRAPAAATPDAADADAEPVRRCDPAAATSCAVLRLTLALRCAGCLRSRRVGRTKGQGAHAVRSALLPHARFASLTPRTLPRSFGDWERNGRCSDF